VAAIPPSDFLNALAGCRTIQPDSVTRSR